MDYRLEYVWKHFQDPLLHNHLAFHPASAPAVFQIPFGRDLKEQHSVLFLISFLSIEINCTSHRLGTSMSTFTHHFSSQ